MYWPELDKWANVRSSDLVEELGQIEFIFSDKTGTLTQNKMELTAVSVAGTIYNDTSSKTTANLASKEKNASAAATTGSSDAAGAAAQAAR